MDILEKQKKERSWKFWIRLMAVINVALAVVCISIYAIL